MITKTKPNQTKPNQTKFYRQKYSDILAFDFSFLFFYYWSDEICAWACNITDTVELLFEYISEYWWQ